MIAKSFRVYGMLKAEIKKFDRMVPNAYHGTYRVNAGNILREGFKITRNPHNYLGDGVYFYEGSIQLARNFALNVRKFGSYAIIQANVQLGICLDLNTPEHCEILKAVREAIIEEDKDKEKDITDSFVINWFICHCNPEVETVKWTLTKHRKNNKTNKIYPGSRIKPNEPMICVRNIGNISNARIIAENRK